MPKNFIAVLETGSLAGGVRVVGEICNRLARKDWNVSIYSLNPKMTMDWFKLDRSIEWMSFYQTGTIRDYAQLEAVLAKQNAYKMATFWRTAFPVARASKPGEGLYLVQDIETSYTSQPLLAEVAMGSYDLGLKMVTTSRWVESRLPGSHHIGIGLGGQYSFKNQSRNGRPLALLRRQALKGFSELMEVARILHANGKILKTFGMDDPRSLNNITRVDHEGRGPDGLMSDDRIVDLYNTHSAYVCTSKHEGFNLPVLEAMACGLPVVTSNNDGNSEYCVDGVNCYVRQDPRDIAKATLELLEDRTTQAKFRSAGIDTARRYRWDTVIQSLERVLT